MSREVVADSGADGWGADLSVRQIALCLRSCSPDWIDLDQADRRTGALSSTAFGRERPMICVAPRA
jgi:hypothetical protein